MSRELNELIAIRNSMVGEEEQIELYDVMDAADNEEQAIDYLKAEIKNMEK